MAPKKGGSGGTGGGGSTSSSSTCGSYSTYPCTTGLYQIYGDASSSLYSQAELYGQIILFSIWTIALAFLLFASAKTKAHSLRMAILLFIGSFIFLCVRFGLIISESDVPIGYRFESSVVILLERLGMVFLFAGAVSPDSGKLLKVLFLPALGVYAILEITYIILDFLISSKALNNFKDGSWSWRLSDRDAALTSTMYSIHELLWNGDTLLSPFYVDNKMIDSSSEDGWQRQRGIQIKIGVAADFLAVVLAVALTSAAGVSLLRRSKKTTGGSAWLLVAAGGLLLTALFRVIVSTHYVLWNWRIVSDDARWLTWYFSYNEDASGFSYSRVGDGFLEGYRTVVTGFPVVQAIFEPLGVVLAAAAMVMWWRKKLSSVDIVV